MIYELLGYNTDCRYSQDVRYRRYTTSTKLAKQFERIPRIQFTDSGHGIVFTAREHHGKKKPEVSEVYDHVVTEFKKIREQDQREWSLRVVQERTAAERRAVRTSQIAFKCLNNTGVEKSFDIGVSYVGFWIDKKWKLIEDKTGVWYKCPADFFETSLE